MRIQIGLKVICISNESDQYIEGEIIRWEMGIPVAKTGDGEFFVMDIVLPATPEMKSAIFALREKFKGKELFNILAKMFAFNADMKEIRKSALLG